MVFVKLERAFQNSIFLPSHHLSERDISLRKRTRLCIFAVFAQAIKATNYQLLQRRAFSDVGQRDFCYIVLSMEVYVKH